MQLPVTIKGEAPVLSCVRDRNLWITCHKDLEHAEPGSCDCEPFPMTAKLLTTVQSSLEIRVTPYLRFSGLHTPLTPAPLVSESCTRLLISGRVKPGPVYSRCEGLQAGGWLVVLVFQTAYQWQHWPTKLIIMYGFNS